MAFNIPPLNRVVWKNVKLLKAAWKEAQKRLLPTLRNEAAFEPIPIRVQPNVPHAARLRQTRAATRWFSTQASRRTFSTTAPNSAPRFDRSTYPKSRTASAIQALPGRAPFASTLRPNLTGGTLNRTAGGYAFGGSGRAGGARHFSHGPAAPQQVVQNVSQAIRAFALGGQRGQFDGATERGEKRFRAVSTLHAETVKKVHALPRATPGSFVEFQVNTTITALTPLSGMAGFPFESQDEIERKGLASEGLLDILSSDFSRTLKDLTAVLSDIKRLSGLGDLPITYNAGSHGFATLRVHFPGCDAARVEDLCSELHISRGVVVQDAAFDAYVGAEMALLFPFAPSNSSRSTSLKESLETDSSSDVSDLFSFPSEINHDHFSTRSEQSYSAFDAPQLNAENNPWTFSGSAPPSWAPASGKSASSMLTESHGEDEPLEYQDFEGIYRFIAECDNARRPL